MLLRFKFRKADEGRFRVTIFTDEKEFAEGHLNSSIEDLKFSFNQWQEAYLGLDDVALRLTSLQKNKSFSRDDINKFAESFRLELDKWLGGDEKWRQAREKLAKQLANSSENKIRIFFDVDESILREFPWEDWEFLQLHCQEAEVAIFEKMDTVEGDPSSGSVKVLVVVGNNEGIAEGVREDLQAIEELRYRNKGVFKILEQPSPNELLKELRKNDYEIFIFTGHSGSENGKDIGWIELSQTDKFKISDLKNSLRKAITKRLKLCIFNSCDGLGLAKELAKLKLPQIIVMREPVPDDVAAKFLRVFLDEYSSNESFFNSFREAQHQLEGFNDRYPSVCWLPAVSMSTMNTPPTWKELAGNPPKRFITWKKIALSCLAILFASGSFLVFRLRHPQRLYCSQFISENCYYHTINDIKLPKSSGPIRYGGSTSAVPIAQEIEKVITAIHPSLIFLNSFGNTGRTLGTMLDPNIDPDNKLHFFFASSPLSVLNAESVPIAYDAVAVVVNPSLHVTSLNLDDLRRIILGEVNDWKDFIGGASIPINVYFRPESGTTKFMKEILLTTEAQRDSAFKGSNFFPLNDPQSPLKEAKSKIKNDLGGIYFVTASESVYECEFKPILISIDNNSLPVAPYKDNLTKRNSTCANLPKDKRNKVDIQAIKSRDYPLTRPIYLIIRNDDEIAKEWGKFFLNALESDEGKNLIEKAGF